MQNQIINFELLNNAADALVLINPSKQQVYSIAKEESQMIPGQSYTFTGSLPAGYLNDPANQSENRGSFISATSSVDQQLNANFMPTDYIGMSVYEIPTFINEIFSDITFINSGTISSFYTSVGGHITNLISGTQLFNIPANKFLTILTDPTLIAANGGSNMLWNYGTYYVVLAPKYIQSTITGISPKYHYPVTNLADDENIGPPVSPIHLRRTIYHCPNEDFIGTNWNFEAYQLQQGRLIGSVVEIWNSSLTVLKQTKIMNEDSFNFQVIAGTTDFILSPDNFGYDPATQDIIVGDIIKVFPRETAFNQIIIKIDFVDKQKTVKAALQFLMNDVVQNMNTATIEVYDDSGVTIDPTTGNFDGNVIQSYQITQFGNYQVRQIIN